MISIEYRSAIFTTSDAQAVCAKLVTEEIQAKYFTPKGKFSFHYLWIPLCPYQGAAIQKCREVTCDSYN